MRRRPRPNPRRGFLRAAAAVVLLIIVLIVVVIVASSLTAPAVKAPTVPPTPGPITSTPVSRTPTARATATPRSRPTSTPGKKRKPKTLALGSSNSVSSADERSADSLILQAARVSRTERMFSAAASPDRRSVASFDAGTASASSPLLLSTSSGTRTLGPADAFVRPVWSDDGGHLLYVRVRQTSGVPGARWTLMEWNRTSDRSVPLAEASALGLIPLGWSQGHVLYLVSRSTATTLYDVLQGRSRLVSLVLAQPLVDASLAPGGARVALVAPANCGDCTVDVFDLNRLTLWVGPTGLPNGTTMAWSGDGRALVVQLRSRLAAIDIATHHYRFLFPVRGLGDRWVDTMRARLQGGSVALTDTVDGRTYRSNGR